MYCANVCTGALSIHVYTVFENGCCVCTCICVCTVCAYVQCTCIGVYNYMYVCVLCVHVHIHVHVHCIQCISDIVYVCMWIDKHLPNDMTCGDA